MLPVLSRWCLDFAILKKEGVFLMARSSDKRSRLVLAADKLFYEQGVTVTTLANIAQLADVPLGNVYYYFKTKEEIILAVIALCHERIKQQIKGLNDIGNTRERLQALVRQAAGHSAETAKFGDVLGSLCQELGKHGGQLATAAASLLQEIISWCETRFTALSKTDKARKLVMVFVSRLQGISLLTLTFKNRNYTNQQTEYLVNWLEALAKGVK
mgnify:CR=1 FL=1